MAADPHAGATATCRNCGQRLIRGGSDTPARPGNFYWRHTEGWIRCAEGQGIAMPAPDSIEAGE